MLDGQSATLRPKRLHFGGGSWKYANGHPVRPIVFPQPRVVEGADFLYLRFDTKTAKELPSHDRQADPLHKTRVWKDVCEIAREEAPEARDPEIVVRMNAMRKSVEEMDATTSLTKERTPTDPGTGVASPRGLTLKCLQTGVPCVGGGRRHRRLGAPTTPWCSGGCSFHGAFSRFGGHRGRQGRWSAGRSFPEDGRWRC